MIRKNGKKGHLKINKSFDFKQSNLKVTSQSSYNGNQTMLISPKSSAALSNSFINKEADPRQ